ncbi:MAG TPA: hypothetical protein VNJ08_14455 [Bacteriovoracaceae bacterium]|nr:hypothetical protein [Bacteriovoracaceae bacterium]
MKHILLPCLILLAVSCSGGGGSASSEAQVSSASSTTTLVPGKEFIKLSHSSIEVPLQIQNEDLLAWKQEGLITEEESATISENL